MTMVYATKSRGISLDIVIKDADGNTITPGANDKVRATIGRSGHVAKLVVVSNDPTDNGSSITKGATNRLRIDADDLDFDSGTYTLTIDYFDNADSQEWKLVERQVFHLEE